MIKQLCLSVFLILFTLRFVFRVQMGWDMETTLILSSHSKVLCESVHSVFPSDRMHLFPITTVDKVLSVRISFLAVPGEKMTNTQMDG